MRKRKGRIFLAITGGILSLCSCGGKSEQIFFAQEAAETVFVQEESEETAVQEEVQVVVFVCGAVCEPGVFSLKEGSRVADAIARAGGMTPEADTDYLNQAALLQDGEKLYVPTKEEVLLWEISKEESSLVNINTADAQMLCTLPGIGESRAADIIAYRTEQGAFQCIEDIMKVSGIKDSLFAKIKDFITVD